jgi:hypothetical protein
VKEKERGERKRERGKIELREIEEKRREINL